MWRQGHGAKLFEVVEKREPPLSPGRHRDAQTEPLRPKILHSLIRTESAVLKDLDTDQGVPSGILSSPEIRTLAGTSLNSPGSQNWKGPGLGPGMMVTSIA